MEPEIRLETAKAANHTPGSLVRSAAKILILVTAGRATP